MHLTAIIDRLRLEHIRDSTRKNYYSVWKCFNEFFLKLDVKPNTWEDRLTLFTGFLIHKGKRSQTVKSYISAMRTVLKEDGFELNDDKFILSSLTQACKVKNDRMSPRFPIHKAMVNIIVDKMLEYFQQQNQSYLANLVLSLQRCISVS